MANRPTISEQWFDEYLTMNGYSFRREPDLGVRTRPDRVINRAGMEAICEIKEFTTDAMQRRWPQGGSQIGSFSAQEWLLTVGRAINRAARKLEPLSGDQRPLLIVLANPHRVAALLRGADELMEAMYGELMLTFPVDTGSGAPVSEPQWVLGDGGRLSGEKAPWVSAVAVLHRGDRRRDWEREWIEDWRAQNWPEGPDPSSSAFERSQAYQPELDGAIATGEPPSGEYFYVEVVETMSREAVPLPQELFDGERDKRWIFNPDERRYELRT